MNTITRKLSWLAYGVCLVASVYSCKTKDVDAVDPFTYSFKELENIQLPTVTPTAPAAVTVVEAKMTSSTQAAAVSAGLANLTAGGQVPAAVQQAGAEVEKAVSASKAAELNAAFTPTLMSSLATGGKLPDNLQKEVASLASNPALQAYLPTFTLPQVNGKTVGARIGAPVKPVVVTMDQESADACRAAATAAFNAAKARLDAQLSAQTGPVTNAYNTAAAAAAAEVVGCQSAVPAKYTPMITAATTQFNTGIANLNAGRAVLGETLYNLLTALYNVAYAQSLSGIATLQSADNNLCTATSAAKVAAAVAARDADLNTINTNYNTQIAAAQASVNTATAACHNQGAGR
ncbi:hypothetical protein [Spirosoma sp. KUDC1026]|uniref:hypothetical protein n=1 Tax=Spirosoma sp. KUDC1026 TaxID=2745947 RepID=UPI00159B8F04|nr:hypothetical protein [Spirosoma sp. KUDC1026]QKZ15441.1 hypothetical protein HU175_23615 [Spirosoma sp. KUDC1026]